MSKIVEWVKRNPVLLFGLVAEIVHLVQANLEEGLSSGELAVALAIGVVTIVQRALVTPVADARLPVDVDVERYVR